MIVIISIHSLRMEGDIQADIFKEGAGHISIHSLRMEGDQKWNELRSGIEHFNPLPPHGGRHLVKLIRFWAENISIHSLRMEGDSVPAALVDVSLAFQSTPSAWRETDSFF